MTTATSGTLRIIMSLVVVGTAIYAGFTLRSPWIILPMTLAFTLLYVAGKWLMWKSAYLVRGLLATVGNFLITIPIQMIVCGVFYLIGYGLGSMLGSYIPAHSLTSFDWYLVTGLCAVALPATAIITWIERAPLEEEEAKFGLSPGITDEPELVISPQPVTVDTFFQGVHFSHYDYERADPDHVPDETVTKPAQIEEAEQRLGIVLPSLLRKLYERQNGGDTGPLFLPAKDNPGPTYDDWRMAFSHDYNELKPLDQLRTYYDRFLDWGGDPKDPDETKDLPPNAKQIILLSNRYSDTTYLDYSKPGEPTVGVVDFDPHTSETNLHFESFEAFFAQLRREVED